MSFGKGSNTSTSTQTPNPAAMAAYNDLLTRAGQVASTPYTAYGGEGVAGINAQQMLGINNINQNAGFAMPYIQQAGQYAQQAAQPLSAADIQRYESPYTQDVINATQNQFNTQNAQQQSQVMGNAAAQGALGGNRAGVAQALTAGQQQMAQAPVIANLQNQGYQTGLNTALAEQQNLGQAAYSLGNLGVAGQNAALSGANAQFGAGTAQQQTQQMLDQYLYGQFQQQQAYPYQQLSWLAGIDTGVGSNMGGQSQTTGPSPNPWAQWLGLGAVGLGAYGKSQGSKYGGRIAGFARPHYDGGGGVGGMPWAGAPSWIPAMQITHGKGPPSAPNAPSPQKNPAGDPASLAKGLTGLGSGLGDLGGSAATSLGEAFPETMASVAEFLPFLALKKGGGVAGFAEGGAPDYGDLEGGFDPDVGAFSPTPGLDAPVSFLPATRFGPKDDDRTPYALGDIGPGTGFDFNPRRGDEGAVPLPVPRGMAKVGYVSPEDSLPDDMRLPDLPPARTVPDRRVAGLDVSADKPTGGLGLRPGSQGAPDLPPQSKQAGFGGLFHLSDAASTGLMAAGLGMMASRSPFLANAIGEGGLAGMSAYSGTKHEEASAKQVADKMAQHAEETRKKLEHETAKEARLAQEHEARLAYQRQLLEQGRTPAGYRVNNGNLEAIPGGPADPEAVQTLATAKRPKGTEFDEDTVKVMADAIQGGNPSVLTNLGAGAQKAENVAKVWNEIAHRVVANGGTGADLNAARANFMAQMGAAKSQAVRAANVEANIEEARQTFPLALEASKKVPRTEFVPLNRAIQMVQSGTSSPALRQFVTANAGVITAYSQAMARAGVATVDGRHAAEALLSTADGPDAYEAVLQQMEKEMHAAAIAPETVRQGILSRISGRAMPAAAAPATGGPPRVDKAAYDALPHGAPYTAPDGSVRTKQ